MTTAILPTKRNLAQPSPEAGLPARSPAKRRTPALAALLLAAMVPMAAHAIDVDVADYVPAPEGTTVGLL